MAIIPRTQIIVPPREPDGSGGKLVEIIIDEINKHLNTTFLYEAKGDTFAYRDPVAEPGPNSLSHACESIADVYLVRLVNGASIREIAPATLTFTAGGAGEAKITQPADMTSAETMEVYYYTPKVQPDIAGIRDDIAYLNQRLDSMAAQQAQNSQNVTTLQESVTAVREDYYARFPEDDTAPVVDPTVATVTELRLVDADASTTAADNSGDVVLTVLTDGMEIDKAAAPYAGKNIAVVAIANAITKSVKMAATGASTHAQTENVKPFGLNGDSAGKYYPFALAIGTYTFTCTPYTETSAGGTQGAGVTLTIKVVDSSVVVVPREFKLLPVENRFTRASYVPASADHTQIETWFKAADQTKYQWNMRFISQSAMADSTTGAYSTSKLNSEMTKQLAVGSTDNVMADWEGAQFKALRDNPLGSAAYNTAEAFFMALADDMEAIRPTAKKTIYDIPFHAYTESGTYGWTTFNEGKFNLLIPKLDFLSPSLYMQYAEEERSGGRQAALDYLAFNLKGALIMGKKFNKPVIPLFWNRVHTSSGGAYANDIIQTPVFVEYCRFIFNYQYDGVKVAGLTLWDGVSTRLNKLGGINGWTGIAPQNGTDADKDRAMGQLFDLYLAQFQAVGNALFPPAI